MLSGFEVTSKTCLVWLKWWANIQVDGRSLFLWLSPPPGLLFYQGEFILCLFILISLLVFLLHSLVHPELRLLHKQPQVIQVIFDLFVAFHITVRHEQLHLAKGAQDLLSLRKMAKK